MRKFGAIVALLVSVLSGCAKPESAKPQQLAQSAQTDEPIRKAATLSEQKMCSEQAKKNFDGSGFSDDKTSTYTSHYDSATNVCYIEVTTRDIPPLNIPSYNNTILDAFENRAYGDFSLIYRNGQAPEKLGTCHIQPRGQAEISCNSKDEFNRLALQHFGIVPD